MTPCPQPGCTGTVLADGYCDTCGMKAAAAPVATAAPVAATAPAAPAAASCPEPGCTGKVLADGYCDTCGMKAVPAPAASAVPSRSLALGSARSGGSRRTASGRTRSTSRRSAIGAGLVDVPPAPAVDPAAIVMADAQVAEEKRFCSKCGSPVGRSHGSRPGRMKGFCGNCRHPYDFVPKLSPGERVAGQYEVVGPLAHGGVGWIYLARDRAVNDRWSVLKGLLDAGDEAAMAAAVSERRFLAEIQHPNIVEIYNFVTHRGAGYIVMEYVGGPSLKQILKQRREANGGNPDPLPPAQGIAYVLAILPAFSYLHGRGLVYCDFKPDNMIQVGDQMRLIDLGGVRRLDDLTGDIYGTVGFQAPEIAEMGPSVASDVYTIGRTLAVLTLDFRGYQTTYQHSLPEPSEHPVLAGFDSYYRLLLKATAEHPDDRFTSVHELSDQLLGVLREVVALTTGTAQPGKSAVFAGVPHEGELPALTLDPGDPAAGFLANLGGDDPAEVRRAIDEAVALGHVPETVEVRLRRARVLQQLGQHDAARAELDRIEAEDPWEWRAVWLRGVSALDRNDLASAAGAFDRCRSEVPGELAPKLAAAITAERAGDLATAAGLYEVVSAVDPAYVGASTGLARCRLTAGDVAGAIEAYGRIPRTHRAYLEAQLAAVRALVRHGRVGEAARVAEGLQLDDRRRAEIEVELLEGALTALLSGSVKADPAVRLAGHPFDEAGVRRGLEEACRRLADLTPDAADRIRLVDRANAVRPFTLV